MWVCCYYRKLLKRCVVSKHEGVIYPCPQGHVENKHWRVRYPCSHLSLLQLQHVTWISSCWKYSRIAQPRECPKQIPRFKTSFKSSCYCHLSWDTLCLLWCSIMLSSKELFCSDKMLFNNDMGHHERPYVINSFDGFL